MRKKDYIMGLAQLSLELSLQLNDGSSKKE